MGDQLEVVREMDAPADRVWGLVSDITRMGDWSPEAVEHEWLDGADGPAVGARFRGRNRKGRHRWSTIGEVVECEPGRSFAFEVTSIGLPVARWGYSIEPLGEDRCRVTETWIERRGLVITVLGRIATGTADRAERNRQTMGETLDALAAEAASTAG